MMRSSHRRRTPSGLGSDIALRSKLQQETRSDLVIGCLRNHHEVVSAQGPKTSTMRTPSCSWPPEPPPPADGIAVVANALVSPVDEANVPWHQGFLSSRNTRTEAVPDAGWGAESTAAQRSGQGFPTPPVAPLGRWRAHRRARGRVYRANPRIGSRTHSCPQFVDGARRPILGCSPWPSDRIT